MAKKDTKREMSDHALSMLGMGSNPVTVSDSEKANTNKPLERGQNTVASPKSAKRQIRAVPDKTISRDLEPAINEIPETSREAESSELEEAKMPKTYSLPKSTIDAVADCVVALQRKGGDLNLSSFVEEALREKVQRAEVDFNKGKSFPVRDTGPRRGRPIK